MVLDSVDATVMLIPKKKKKLVTRRFTYTEFITRFHIQPSKGGIFLSGEG